MAAKATSRRPPSSDAGVVAAVLGWLLFGTIGLLSLPDEAEARSGPRAKAVEKKAKQGKQRRPSATHRKLRAAIEKDAQAGEQAGEGKLGAASFYGFGFQGRRVANGERFDVKRMTAASNHYPLGSWVAVKRLDSGRCVVVKINDRMHSAHRTRIIDLSRGAAEKLHMISDGVVLVRVARLQHGTGDDMEADCQRAFRKVRVPDCVDCDVQDEHPLPALPNISDLFVGSLPEAEPAAEPPADSIGPVPVQK